jgi:hypothetical protein
MLPTPCQNWHVELYTRHAHTLLDVFREEIALQHLSQLHIHTRIHALGSCVCALYMALHNLIYLFRQYQIKLEPISLVPHSAAIPDVRVPCARKAAH